MRRAQLVSEASQIPVGGSEDEAKERVKKLFQPDRNKCKYADMSADDIAELDKQHKENKDG